MIAPHTSSNSAGSSSGSCHVAVVGAGLAGLAASVELLSRGHRVTLIEKNAHLGGKMNLLDEQGYRFDMGPTIITLPQVLRGIIGRSGRRVEDYIDLVALDPQWRCFYEDGVMLDLWGDPEKMQGALDRQFPGTGAGDGYRKFIEYSRRMYRLSEKVFFYKDLGAIADLIKSPPPSDPDLLRDVIAMRLHSTVGATAHRMIPEPHIRQLTEHFLQYVGSSPFLAPAILSLIASAQTDQGCWYPMGGTRMVARSLERIVREYTEAGQATILTNTRVVSMDVQGERVAGVRLSSGEVLSADRIVSNCDVQRTYRDLIASDAAIGHQGRIARKYSPACSGLVLYLGLSRQYEHLAHHNFVFSGSSHHEFEDIYAKGIPARDPTLYIAAPSRTDDQQAPEGCEALYILIHTPYLRHGQEWHGEGGLLEKYRPVVMEKLRTTGGMPDIDEHIVVEKHLTPNMIDTMYNAEGGAIYGLASHGKLAGGFKPRNRSRLYKNLYIAGGSANPGPGVPMVLMSGVTAAVALCEDQGEKIDYTALTTSEQTPWHTRVRKTHPAEQSVGIG